ncbi:MAG TPA: hypothetical protein VF525_11915 [Pyrinomonadaceae bacterium]|jgi:hypothetical protein
MNMRAPICLLFLLLGCAAGRVAFAQTQPAASPPPHGADTNAHAADKEAAREHPLKRFTGRYELETGIIPISTLDVTLEGNDLWLKPSLVKKRRLTQKARFTFVDEIEGKRYKFGRDSEGHITSVSFDYEGGSYTAQRVLLPAPSLQGNTTFRLAGHAQASLVTLAGSFNNWQQSQLVCARADEAWVCRIDLEPGRYTYKFIVDGNWVLDPANPETEEDEAGNINNVLVVAAKPPPVS